MQTGLVELVGVRAIPAVILIMILLNGVGSYVPNAAAQQEQSANAHFNASIDVYIDSQFQSREYKFQRGNTVYFSAWSNAYTDNGSGLLATPHTNFTIEIVSPENVTIYHQKLTAGDDGSVQFSLLVGKNFTFGTYDVRYTAEHKGFKTITPYSPEPDVSYSPVMFVVIWGPEDFVNVNDKYKFELLEATSTYDGKDMSTGPAKFGSYLTLKAKICPSPFSLLPNGGTYGPTDRPALEGQSPEILVSAKFAPQSEQTSENNASLQTQNITTSIIQDSCASPFEISSGSLTYAGKWSVTATALWLQKNDTQHVFQADSNQFSFDVASTIYRSSNVARIILDPDKYQNTIPLDWNPDSKSILFSFHSVSSEKQKLGIVALDKPENVTEFYPLLEDLGNVSGEPVVQDARFVSSDDKIIFLYGSDLYSYDLQQKRAIRLTQSGTIYSFDMAPDGRLFYNENGTFVLADSEAKNPESIFSGGQRYDMYYGDLSPDGSKVLYRKVLDSGYQWINAELAYYDIQTKKETVIPNVKNNCGSFPKWAPNGYHLLVQESSCSRGWPGGTLKITDLNGSFEEYIVPATNDNPNNFIFSPDGNSILISFSNYGSGGAVDSMGGPASFYVMSLARPVPEFGSIIILILAITTSLAILVGRAYFFK